MFRKALLTSALVAAAVAYTWAAERVTYVLSNGEHKSGTVAVHGDGAVQGGRFFLRPDAGGDEAEFPIAQVVVLDFAGGRPTSAERTAVPSDNSQLLVFRNGQTQKGTLLNLMGGDTVVWRGENGNEQRFPIADVSRVYLNGQAARTAYLRGGERSTTSTASTASTAPVNTAVSRSVAPGTFEISGAEPWFDTGITVRRGERYAFQVNGNITIMADGSPATPDGRTGIRSPVFPVPTALAGALIAKVGAGQPFLVGSQTAPIGMPVAGRLMLGINDDNFADNGGVFTVKVIRQ